MITDQLVDAQMPRPGFLQNAQRPSFLQNWQRPAWLNPQPQSFDTSQLWNLYSNAMFGGIGVPNQNYFQNVVQPMADRGTNPVMMAERLKAMNMG